MRDDYSKYFWDPERATQREQLQGDLVSLQRAHRQLECELGRYPARGGAWCQKEQRRELKRRLWRSTQEMREVKRQVYTLDYELSWLPSVLRVLRANSYSVGTKRIGVALVITLRDSDHRKWEGCGETYIEAAHDLERQVMAHVVERALTA